MPAIDHSNPPAYPLTDAPSLTMTVVHVRMHLPDPWHTASQVALLALSVGNAAQASHGTCSGG